MCRACEGLPYLEQRARAVDSATIGARLHVVLGCLCHPRHAHMYVRSGSRCCCTNRRPRTTKPVQRLRVQPASRQTRRRRIVGGARTQCAVCRIAGLFIKREPALVSHQVKQACNSVSSEHPGCRGRQAHISFWATLLVLAPSTAPVQPSPATAAHPGLLSSVPFESVWRPCCPVCAR